MSPSCVNCGKHYERKCLICGYDPKTGQFKFSRKELGLNEAVMPMADIWVGFFPDEELFKIYFEEYESSDEDEYQSTFAEEQEIRFYDRDFFVTWFGVESIETACREVFAPEMDLSEIQSAITRSSRTDFNTVAMQTAELSDKSTFRTIKADGYWIHYLGRFNCLLA